MATGDRPPSRLDFGAFASTALFPLHGLRCEKDGACLGEAAFMRLEPDQWSHVEKTDVGKEIGIQRALAADLLGLEVPVRPSPVFCVFQGGEIGADPDLEWSTAVGRMSSLLLALRLHRPGMIVDPALAGIYWAGPSGMVRRFPGLYRQELSEIDPGEGYLLDRESLGSVERIWSLVTDYERSASHPSADIARECFTHSFGPYLAEVDRLALLYAAIEAMFGRYEGFRGEDAEIPDEERLSGRVARAAGSVDGPSVDLQRFLRKSGRSLRNHVAHGGLGPPPVPLDEGVERLTEVVRVSLLRYLRFSIEYANETGRESMAAWMDAGPAGAPGTAFNELLREAARGRTEAQRMLARLRE